MAGRQQQQEGFDDDLDVNDFPEYEPLGRSQVLDRSHFDNEEEYMRYEALFYALLHYDEDHIVNYTPDQLRNKQLKLERKTQVYRLLLTAQKQLNAVLESKLKLQTIGALAVDVEKITQRMTNDGQGLKKKARSLRMKRNEWPPGSIGAE